MKNENQTDTLNETIVLLQNEQAKELKLLTKQFYETYESLKPINLIKNTLLEVTSSPEIKRKLLKNMIGLTVGYLSKKIIVGASQNLLKKNIASLLQIAITMVVSKYSDTIITNGENFLKRIFKREMEIKQ